MMHCIAAKLLILVLINYHWLDNALERVITVARVAQWVR
jgi:hypothetical protein